MLLVRQITVLEQLIEVLPNYYMCGGICDVVKDLCDIGEINTDEKNYIIRLLEKYKPTMRNQYKEFTKNNFFVKNSNNYWWNPMFEFNETIQIRIDFLKRIVEILEKLK